MAYWAIRPQSWTKEEALKVCRIDQGKTEKEAIEIAFGRGCRKGQWLVKKLTLQQIRSDKQRVQLLHEDAGWYDPMEV